MYLYINNIVTDILIKDCKNYQSWKNGLSDESENIDGWGLRFNHCHEIQMKTCFISLDVVFINKKGKVIKCKTLNTGDKNYFSLFGSICLELPIGTINKYEIKKNDILSFDGKKEYY